jgi:hypothetical protein
MTGKIESTTKPSDHTGITRIRTSECDSVCDGCRYCNTIASALHVFDIDVDSDGDGKFAEKNKNRTNTSTNRRGAMTDSA